MSADPRSLARWWMAFWPWSRWLAHRDDVPWRFRAYDLRHVRGKPLVAGLDSLWHPVWPHLKPPPPPPLGSVHK